MSYAPRRRSLITDEETKNVVEGNWKYSFVVNKFDNMVYTVMWKGQLVRFNPTTDVYKRQTGYRSIYLSPYYYLKVSKDTVVAYLPYFGRAYTAPADPTEGGIKFTSTKMCIRDRNMPLLGK